VAQQDRKSIRGIRFDRSFEVIDQSRIPKAMML
jgi:hypothetical protein